MTTPQDRLRMAKIIVNFEARRDGAGHLMVYMLPRGDGGGKYEVAGINERYNKDTADLLVSLINQKRFAEAESVAEHFIADDTDRAASWTRVPALESYLRDCVFNRGLGGAARILQFALGVDVDGVVGNDTRTAMAAAQTNPGALLDKLRASREHYERTVVRRSETSKFWKGLVNRWNNALTAARTFPLKISA